jgi:hypothetical protein
MYKSVKRLVIFALALFLAVSCNMGGMGGAGSAGEGSLTVSLGNSAREASGEAALPDLPTFSKITITVKNGELTVDSIDLTSNSKSHTFSLPSGSEYTVEADADVETPTTFGLRYGGTAKVTIQDGEKKSVDIHLSVTETMLVGKDSPSNASSGKLSIYRSFGSIGTLEGAPTVIDNSISKDGDFFFDRYGRLFFIGTSSSTTSLSMYSGADTAAQSVSVTPPEGVNSMESFSVAHPIGTNLVYVYGYRSDSRRFGKIDLSALNGGSSVAEEFVDIASLIDGKLKIPESHVAADKDSLYVGGTLTADDSKSGIVKIAHGSTGYEETGYNGELAYTILDMELINGTLYVVGYDRPTNAGAGPMRVRLHAYDTGDFAGKGSWEEKEAVYTAREAATTVTASIAGWGKDTVYVFYDDPAKPEKGMVKVTTGTGTWTPETQVIPPVASSPVSRRISSR